ncbi:MAG: amidase, partial [Sphingomonas sp.]|nr:amidase [Sphingomonas sp.]
MIDWDDLEARNAPLNAFVDCDKAAVRGDGPLAGITVGIKSNIAVKGLPWTGGMGTRRDVIADRDATVVAQLRAAGAVILGTLNMHEAALGATTDNAFYGRTHNPHRLGYTPGGSSGGSGAAVAGALCDVAVGTDTLGSIRIPAAYCGIWGLKPTIGAVSDDGLVHLGTGFDCIGPLARDLDLLARVWAVMSPDPSSDAPFTRALTLADLGEVPLQPAVAQGYRRALAAIDRREETLSLDDTLSAIRMAGLIDSVNELIGDLGEACEGPLVSGEIKFVLGAVGALPPTPTVIERTRATMLAALGDDAVLVMPTAPQVAFAHGTRAPVTQADFTSVASVAGLPALSIPAGFDADHLPVGVQLVGSPHSEMRLIALAREIEATI